MSVLDKVLGAPERANGGDEVVRSKSVEPKITGNAGFFNDLAHQLITLAMSHVGRGNDAGVHDLLQASRVVLDLDPRR